MTPTLYQTAPMAAYVSLNQEGDALYRFCTFGQLTVSDARMLAAKGWIEPDPVKIAKPDGDSLLFKFASLALSGGIIWNELQSWVSEAEFEWGATWNVRESVTGRHSPPEEAKMVHTRSLIRLMQENNIDLLYNECASDWWPGDMASYNVEDVTLPQH